MKLTTRKRDAMVAVLCITLTGVGIASVSANAALPIQDAENSASEVAPSPARDLEGYGSVLGPVGEKAFDEEMERREMAAAPLGDASDAVGAYLDSSGWEGFSRLEIEDQARMIIKGIGPIPDDILQGAIAHADGFPIRYQEVTFRDADYLAKAEVLFDRLGDDGKLVFIFGPTNHDTVEAILLQSDHAEYIEREIREVFEGFPLEVKLAPADTPRTLQHL